MEQQTQQPAEVNTAANKKPVGEVLKNYFTATRISYMAVFTALAFILRLPWFEFSIIPAVPFLKVDFSDVFVMIAGFSLGPVAGVTVGVLKEVIYGICFTQTAFVGEIANILMILPYILIPSIIYKKRKGIKVVIISLLIACGVRTLWTIPLNYVLTFPLFLYFSFGTPWTGGMEAYLDVWYWALLFNLVKIVLVTAAVMIVYKPLSRLINLTSEKVAKRRRKTVQ